MSLFRTPRLWMASLREQYVVSFCFGSFPAIDCSAKAVTGTTPSAVDRPFVSISVQFKRLDGNEPKRTLANIGLSSLISFKSGRVVRHYWGWLC